MTKNQKEILPKEYKYCLRCGRRLKKPEYQKQGYGKICLQKIQRDNRIPLFRLKS